MFERYTEGARRAVFHGRYEAVQRGSSTIDTDHLLLGIFREDRGLVRQVLLNTDHEALMCKPATQKETTSPSAELPLSKDAERALIYAAQEADRLDSKKIGTEHLLLGLIHDRAFASAQLLEPVVNLELLRKRIEALPRRGPEKDAAPRRPAIRVGDRIEIHGRERILDDVAVEVRRLKEQAYYWERKLWQPRDVVFEKNGKRFSFDLSLAQDSEKFLLVKGWWKKDRCAVCRWELFESQDPEHGSGYTNGVVWVCEECYRRFIEGDYFDGAYVEMT